MKIIPALSLMFAAVLLGAALPAGSDAPVKNFVLKIFTREGPLAYVVRGAVARYRGPDLIDVTDMNITIYSTGAGIHPETILLSPQASFLPAANRAQGQKSVRFIRDDLEAWGTQWTYDHAEKRISLDQQVRVVFHAELKDILK
ncbi:MAG: hypothetical protein EXS39_04050 [Opitutaceae bacterium]|nr:hypothetical protein [Opitutaceae bacterium]